MGKVRLSIGDWSEDGHNQSEDFVYEVNKTVEEIRQAYKDSCVLTGLQFNYNENYSGLPEHNSYGTDRHICTEYEEYEATDLAKEILSEHGLDGNFNGVEGFAELVMGFIKLSLPDLTWEEASFKKSELKNDIPAINGWWNKELNHGFGYGLFH